MELRKFKLLQSILEYPPGYIITIEGGYGRLGQIEGWNIPLEIIEKNKDWFEEIGGLTKVE